MLVATPSDRAADPDSLAGFAYGAHLPGYGGYLCYIGVAEPFRKRGVGTRLYNQMFRVLAADAGAIDESLPFVAWESHMPGPGAPEADWKLWDARVRLFDRVGGMWIDGLELMTPNCSIDDGPPVPLQLFIKPMDVPATGFDATRLRRVAAGLLERVYKIRSDDPLYGATLPPGCEPRLRPATDAARRKEPEKKLMAV